MWSTCCSQWNQHPMYPLFWWKPAIHWSQILSWEQMEDLQQGWHLEGDTVSITAWLPSLTDVISSGSSGDSALSGCSAVVQTKILVSSYLRGVFGLQGWSEVCFPRSLFSVLQWCTTNQYTMVKEKSHVFLCRKEKKPKQTKKPP